MQAPGGRFKVPGGVATAQAFTCAVLLLLGGLFYMVGMVAYATKRPRLWPRVFSYHEVFHVFVVACSTAHYAMTFTYIAGLPAA